MCAGPVAKTFQSIGPWLANRFYCPARSSLTMASSAPLDPSCRFMDYAAGLRPAICSGLGPRGSPIYSACLYPPCRLPYPDGLCGCSWLLLHRTRWPSPHSYRLGIHIPTHDSSGVGVSRGCKVSLMVRPDELASPSPSMTFTLELSPPESPHRDVEYHYAGKQPIPRDRTFTG